MNIMKIVATFKEEDRWVWDNECSVFGYQYFVRDSKTRLVIGVDYWMRSVGLILDRVSLGIDNPIFQTEAKKLTNRLLEEHAQGIRSRDRQRRVLLEEAICKEYC